MRLTALLPPPPTPTTLILADSMGAKEQLTRCRLRAVLVLVGRGIMQVLRALWWNAVGIEDVEMRSFGFAQVVVAIVFCSELTLTLAVMGNGFFRFLGFYEPKKIIYRTGPRSVTFFLLWYFNGREILFIHLNFLRTYFLFTILLLIFFLKRSY